MRINKVDIFQDGRYIGTLRCEAVVFIDEEALAADIERGLPTLKGKKYTISLT